MNYYKLCEIFGKSLVSREQGKDLFFILEYGAKQADFIAVDFKGCSYVTYEFLLHSFGQFYKRFPKAPKDFLRVWNCSTIWKVLIEELEKRNIKEYKEKQGLKITCD